MRVREVCVRRRRSRITAVLVLFLAVFMLVPSLAGAASFVSIPSEEVHYWSGGYLWVDGSVTNNTASPMGPIKISYTVTYNGYVMATEPDGVAFVYNVAPGDSATFKWMFDMPVIRGLPVTVTVSASGVQPSEFTTAVDLTLVSQVEKPVVDGIRTYTCTFRNDSAYTVEEPMVGGLELDADDKVIDSLFGDGSDVRIAPGGVWSVDVYGLNPGASPYKVSIYAQAVRVTPTLNSVYRFFNKNNGSHFYTASADERDYVIGHYGVTYTYEGAAYTVNTSNPNNNAPLYRFYNKNNGSHFYTASAIERDYVIGHYGVTYSYEGPAYNVCASPAAGATPVYRFFNKNNGSHFYTASAIERDYVIGHYGVTYSYEGPAFWLGQ
ncbi:MAG: hypothetical protein HGA39_07820 [Coriobacteriia bacterium]|nr:hypothetical protein [Coriobacteriia bacterium]